MEVERNDKVRVRADFFQVILGERAHELILAGKFNRAAVNCRKQAVSRMGNLPSQARYSLDSEPFVHTRKRQFYGIISIVEIDPKYKEFQ